MVAWTNVSVVSGFSLPSSSMTAMMENFNAISSGYTGAPKIQNAAVESATIGWQAMKTAVGTISVTNSGGGPTSFNIELPSHCFLPSFRGGVNVMLSPVFSGGFTAASADLPILKMAGSGVRPSFYIAYRYLID